MKVSVITVNYNATALTCAMLESVAFYAPEDCEIIVVDNASRVDPGPELLRRFPKIKYLRSETNLGFAGGNNLAIQEAQGEYLFFLNNDATLTAGSLQQLLRFFQEHPRAGIVSPLICYPPNALIQYAGMSRIHPITGRNRTLGSGHQLNGQYKTPFQTAYAHGAAMMVPRAVLETVGAMSEEYFLYYEELDWSDRIRKAGYEVWVEPQALVWHQESATVGKQGASKTYYMTRSRFRFMRKHFSKWQYRGFVVYYTLIAAPRQVLRFLTNAEWQQLRAWWRAVIQS